MLGGDYFFGVGLFLGYHLLIALYNLIRFPRLPLQRHKPRPKVSLLIPARNEAHTLPSTLPALLAQEADEILLLDDLSEDGTLALACATAGRDQRFRAWRGRPPPPGWRGKTWACWQLAQVASGEILVFTDADVLWERGALTGMIAGLEGKDALSAYPRQRVGSFAEAATVPFVMHSPFSFLPHGLLERLKVANGQVMAFKREAYFDVGGHQAVKGEVLEDVALARKVPRFGIFRGNRLFETRMYRTYRALVEGFGKNFLDIHLKNPAILIGSAWYHLSLYVLPWLFGRWELGLLGLLERLLVQRGMGSSLWPALLTPLAPILLVPVYLRALLPGKRWKGRPL
jgi:glycosyltransferase involved in cell wall biosynthesis